jgi:hypothetical protein
MTAMKRGGLGMSLRRELEELRRRIQQDGCPECAKEPIKVVFLRPGEVREDRDPCPVCGREPTVIDWGN